MMVVISNIDELAVNKPTDKDRDQQEEPNWLATCPKGTRPLFRWWKDNLKRGGFAFSARIISYPGGMPGDVGVFISWPHSQPKRQANLKPETRAEHTAAGRARSSHHVKSGVDEEPKSSMCVLNNLDCFHLVANVINRT